MQNSRRWISVLMLVLVIALLVVVSARGPGGSATGNGQGNVCPNHYGDFDFPPKDGKGNFKYGLENTTLVDREYAEAQVRVVQGMCETAFSSQSSEFENKCNKVERKCAVQEEKKLCKSRPRTPGDEGNPCEAITFESVCEDKGNGQYSCTDSGLESLEFSLGKCGCDPVEIKFNQKKIGDKKKIGKDQNGARVFGEDDKDERKKLRVSRIIDLRDSFEEPFVERAVEEPRDFLGFFKSFRFR